MDGQIQRCSDLQVNGCRQPIQQFAHQLWLALASGGGEPLKCRGWVGFVQVLNFSHRLLLRAKTELVGFVQQHMNRQLAGFGPVQHLLVKGLIGVSNVHDQNNAC